MRRTFNNRPELEDRRRELRKALTPAEARLWLHLQRKQLGCKFRRQHGCGPFILDFYCPSRKLAIELDGAPHDSERTWQYDESRSRYLQANGIRVIRFQNADVMKNLDGVLYAIREAVALDRLRPDRPDAR